MFPELYFREFVNDIVVMGDTFTQFSDTFNIVATQNTVTLRYPANIYSPPFVYKNSVLQPATAYTVVGAVVTFTANLVNGNTVVVVYWA